VLQCVAVCCIAGQCVAVCCIADILITATYLCVREIEEKKRDGVRS